MLSFHVTRRTLWGTPPLPRTFSSSSTGRPQTPSQRRWSPPEANGPQTLRGHPTLPTYWPASAFGLKMSGAPLSLNLWLSSTLQHHPPLTWSGPRSAGIARPPSPRGRRTGRCQGCSGRRWHRADHTPWLQLRLSPTPPPLQPRPRQPRAAAAAEAGEAAAARGAARPPVPASQPRLRPSPGVARRFCPRALSTLLSSSSASPQSPPPPPPSSRGWDCAPRTHTHTPHGRLLFAWPCGAGLCGVVRTVARAVKPGGGAKAARQAGPTRACVRRWGVQAAGIQHVQPW